jgi:N-acetylmuramoyl-L-alanine amidase
MINLLIAMLVLFNPPVEEEIYFADLPTVEIVCKLPSDKQVLLLARLINAEAVGEPFEGKLAVANVVQNRMKIKRMSMEEIIFRKGQFDGIHSKRFYQNPPKDCMKAAFLALTGERVIPEGIYYFHNKEIATDTKWVRFLAKFEHETIGQHTFCWHEKYVQA